jgi:predicted transcriptional regulator
VSNLSATHPSYSRMDHRPDPPNPSNPSSDGPSLLERSRAATIARAEQREALASQLSQSYDHPRSNPTADHSLARRRTAQTWDSDEDEGGLADSEDGGYQRHSQIFGEQDEERALAAMRGAIAAGKKIPSKEALASLERIDMKDLKGSDKGKCRCRSPRDDRGRPTPPVGLGCLGSRMIIFAKRI